MNNFAKKESSEMTLKVNRFALASVSIVVIGVFYSLNLIPHCQYSNADFGIPDYRSPHDQDQDGIDDQTDILQSARSYLATQPKYQSKYYATGYPDDNYGVCTDVIAQAFLGAGYDLRELLDEDIRNHPSAYDIDTPDKNIDFRRVQNLHTYLQRHAQSLTTDLDDISAWQGGDIVIFPDHIGIVSNHRNRRGAPFLIHHYSPLQIIYEEDVLGDYQILGHYRIN